MSTLSPTPPQAEGIKRAHSASTLSPTPPQTEGLRRTHLASTLSPTPPAHSRSASDLSWWAGL